MSFNSDDGGFTALDITNETTTGCKNVGGALPDIAGIGVLVSFSAQAFLSLMLAIWVHILSKSGHLDVHHHREGTEEHRVQVKRVESFADMLMVGNDFQVLLGIAYMITAYTKRSTIGLYHLRLAFDTVSFVGVSSTLALAFITYCHMKLNKQVSRLSFRSVTIYIYAAFFVTLTIVLLAYLRQWDTESEIPGSCYSTHGISHPIAPHPAADQLYVSITAIWSLAGMLVAVFAGSSRRLFLLISASMQYVVHLYFMVAVRHVNQPLLEGPEKEDHWDFGQTTAVLLLVLAYVDVVKKVLEYRRWLRMTRGRLDGEYSKSPSNIALIGL